MRCYLLLPLVMACTPSLDQKNYEKQLNSPAVVIQSKSYEIDASRGLELTVEHKSGVLSLKEAQKRLILLLAPVEETLEKSELSRGLPIVVTKTDLKDVWKIKAKELSLRGPYGVYFQDPKSESLELIYTFVTKRGAPKLVSHDLFESDRSVVDASRILFKFTFDQPIYLHDDQAISLVASEPNVALPNVKSLTVESDQETVTVRLVKNTDSVFLVGKKYAFVFNAGLKNGDNEPSSMAPVEFEAVLGGPLLDELSPMAVSSSHSSVEIKWSLNQTHRSDLFVAEDQGSFSRFLRPCPLSNASATVTDEEDLRYLDRFLLGGLASSSQYNFVLRSEDALGQIMIARGTFRTPKPETLRISEVMINPLMKAGQKEHNGEFIEVANVGDAEQKLDDVFLSIEDPESQKITSCALSAKVRHVLIAKDSHFLIVAHDFSKSLYGLDDSVIVVKLEQKTICGGLSNLRKKVIKLHRGDGHFIDSYGGHGWFAKEGRSVQRIDLMGLDDESNYCYTNLLQGPTPGRRNGPCG